MQLCHGYDEVNFPFVIATDKFMAQIFFVNVKTQRRIPLIKIKQIHETDRIWDIQQTSKFAAS